MLTAEQTAPPQSQTQRRESSIGGAWLIVGMLLGAGVVLRIVVMTTSLGTINADEAIVGLMVRHMLNGDFSAFYWGQAYGGTGEQIPFLPFFALFGVSATTIKLMTIAYSALSAFLVWRIARYLMSEKAALIAGAMFWVFPGPTMWWSMKPAGFYWLLMTCGLGTILLTLNIDAERPSGRSALWRFALLGFALGIGWWCNPQIVFFAAPAGIYLVARHWQHLKWAPVVILTAALGAAPWVASNLRNDFASFSPPEGPKTFPERLEITFVRGIPSLFGTKALYSEAWVAGWIGRLAFAGLAVACIAGMVLLVRNRPAGWPIVGMLISYPFLVALTPTSDWVGEGRYMVFATPALVLVLCRLIDTSKFALAIPVLGVLLSAGVLYNSVGYTAPVPGVPVPNSTEELRSELRRLGVQHASANYWVAYRVTFESSEQIIVMSLGPDRTPFYSERVQTDPRAARIIMTASPEDQAFRERAEQVGDITRTTTSNGYSIYIPTGASWPPIEVETDVPTP
jgi:hypothetical protein